ncbi:hypothetical protein NIES4073_71700 [Kalymmatonema gypsitolerans NIES-4073]|nr:hypothetical protein NIES4073_71700 [Scytonema sp. NIES-4073]
MHTHSRSLTPFAKRALCAQVCRISSGDAARTAIAVALAIGLPEGLSVSSSGGNTTLLCTVRQETCRRHKRWCQYNHTSPRKRHCGWYCFNFATQYSVLSLNLILKLVTIAKYGSGQTNESAKEYTKVYVPTATIVHRCYLLSTKTS